MWNNYGIAYSTLWNNHLINQPEIPHYGTFGLEGIRCNSILWNKIYVFRLGGCHMQLFSGRLPLNHTLYADRRWDFSQLDLKGRILFQLGKMSGCYTWQIKLLTARDSAWWSSELFYLERKQILFSVNFQSEIRIMSSASTRGSLTWTNNCWKLQIRRKDAKTSPAIEFYTMIPIVIVTIGYLIWMEHGEFWSGLGLTSRTVCYGLDLVEHVPGAPSISNNPYTVILGNL